MPQLMSTDEHHDVRHYHKQAARSILRLLRTTHPQAVAEDQPDICERKAYNELIKTGTLAYCCTDNANCAVNRQLVEFLKVKLRSFKTSII